MIYGTQTPYIASYLIVQRPDGKVAFVLRSHTSWMNNYYGLPSGKTEKNESFRQGAIREAKEEIGIDVAESDIDHAITVHRKSTNDSGEIMEWVDVYFLATKWTGEPINAEPLMHSELAWYSLDDLPENTIPAVKATLSQWLKGEVYYEYGYDEARP